MITDIATSQPMPPARAFRHTVQTVAMQYLAERAETPEGRAIATRFAMGFAAAATSARNPGDFYSANPASIAAAAAMSLDTGLVPGGAMPEVWLIPRGGSIQWMPSHRGLMRLARTAGYLVRAVVVHVADLGEVEIKDGEVSIASQDPALYVDQLSDVGGVAVFATDRTTGERIAAYWVPGDKIRAAKNAGQGGQVWSKWPAEMAAKAAIKDAFARGYIPLESDELGAALAADPEYSAMTSRVVPSHATAPTALPALTAPEDPTPDDSPSPATESGVSGEY